MKKAIITAALIGLNTFTANAQDVYNEIRNKAKAAIETTKDNDITRHINQFKVDALDYLMIKMQEQMPDSSTTFLDKQALSLNSFINLYIKHVLLDTTAQKQEQVERIKLFMDASYSNPLFSDTDTELTQSYYANPKAITRFMLDTDWRKALLAVEEKMRQEQ